jgi:fructuronate reductase
VLSGDFPAGRPAWDAAGARFVADIEPHEYRKLWLLNGGHSLLAYAGSARGHETIAEAVADPVCRGWLEQWWDEAATHLPLPAEEITDYRAALRERWANPRIQHRLAQIAADGSQKVPIRILPVLRRERADGRIPPGAVRTLAAWIGHLRGAGVPVKDANAGPFVAAAGSARDVLALLDPDLAADDALVAAVDRAAR